MDSLAQQTSPAVNLDHSPAESFLSMPGEMYPSLFDTASTPVESTLNPLDVVTPDSSFDDSTALLDLAQPDEAGTPAPSGEKKQSKKRKSWGQVLPEPKTNLPPRKRAKTEDEKEQRRVERVLRNRRAAQSSRERKRLEVEALEIRNKDLQTALHHAQKANFMLLQELNNLRRPSGVVARSSASLPNPVTFTPELFSSQDGHNALLDHDNASMIDELFKSTNANTTVNPASLSPSLNPVSDENPDEMADDATPALKDSLVPAVNGASPDMTQHPAAMLCSGLQCQSASDAPPPTESVASQLQRSQQQLHRLSSQLQLLLTSASTALSICRRPLTQIAMSSRAGFSLPPSPPILSAIIWLVTTPRASSNSSRRRHSRRPPRPASNTRSPLSPLTTLTSATSSTKYPQRTCRPRPTAAATAATLSPMRRPSLPSTTLRLRTLRRILTCSPNLARPLSDATMGFLRSVSSEVRHVDRVSAGRRRTDASAAGVSAAAAQWPGAKSALPSKEVLLTLLWVLRVEERKQRTKSSWGVSSRPGMTAGVAKI